MKTVTLSPADVIVQEGFNPRTQMELAELERLRDSIKTHGLLQPPVVRETDEGFVLIAGHRRHAACQLAKLAEVTYRIEESESDDLVLAAVENMNRVDLTPVEEADAIQRLLDQGRSQKGVQDELKVSPARFKRALGIAKLGPVARSLVADRKIEGKALERLCELAKHNAKAADAIAKKVAENPQPFANDPVQALRRVPDLVCGHGVYLSDCAYDFSKSAHVSETTKQMMNGTGVQTVFRADAYERLRALGSIVWGDAQAYCFSGADVAGEYAEDAIKAEIARRAENARRAEKAEKEARAPRDEQGNPILSDEEAKAARAKAREEFVAAAVKANDHNQRFTQKLFEKVGPDTVKLTPELAKALAAAVLAQDAGKIAGSGARYVLPGWAEVEETKKGERVKYPKGPECRTKVQEYVMAGVTGEDVLARLLHVLLAAEYVSEDVVAQSSRVGWRPSFDHHGGETSFTEVYRAGLRKIAQSFKLHR